MRSVAMGLALLMILPAVSAEFGDEHAGYPVNVDGQTVWPYIPADLYERHQDLVDDLMAGDPLNKVNGYTAFPYYPLLTAELQRLASENPGLVRMESAGKSRLGLDLWVLEIADFDNPDHIPLEERETIYLDGGTHSNEYSGVYFVTEWLQFLLDEYETNETAQWIVQNRHLFVLPMVNPDGSNAMGRLNAITVNINRNFPGTWGTVASDQPPLNWPGPYPASEPETQAVIKVMQDARPDFVQSTHCCGNLWLHPYGAEHLGHAPDFDMFSNICRSVFPDLTVNVTQPDCGETWSTIYPASGTTLDEGYAQVGASSWSYEMSGRGAVAPWGQPIVDTDVRVQEIESWRGVMHGMLHTEKYGALPTIQKIHVTDDETHVVLKNEGWGNVTEGQLRVGPHAVALPHLLPGEEVTLAFDRPLTGDAVAVDMDYRKRLHPDSNWGHVQFEAPLEAIDGELYAALEGRAEPPSMGVLLPDPAPLVQAPLVSANTIQGATPATQGDTEDAPGLPIAALLIGLAVIALRRR